MSATPTSAEALAALDAIKRTARYLRHDDDYATIRSFITQAAREQRAMRSIEAFCKAHPEVGPSVFFDADGVWTVQVTNEFNEWVAASGAPTRLEALEQCAGEK